MCGIVGFLGAPSQKLDKVFKDLLQVDVVRGWDSTGVFGVSKKSKVKIAKAAVLPQDLFEEPEFKQVVSRQNFLLVGHNRAATKGKITDENAHPFRHGNITLVHNGTLNTQWGLPDHSQFETDSESLCYHINKLGIDEVWPEVYGGTALVWWDSNKRTLNFLRNKDRPLAFAYLPGTAGLIFASEPWMIRSIAERHDITLLENENRDDVFSPAPHQLFSFSWNGKNVSHEQRAIQERKPYYNRHGSQSNVSTLPFRQGTSANQNSTFSGDGGTREASNRVIEDHLENVLGPRGICSLPPWLGPKAIEDVLAEWYADSDRLKIKEHITEELFHKKYINCCSCGEPLVGEFKTSIVIDERKALCNGCTLTAAMNDMDISHLNFSHQ